MFQINGLDSGAAYHMGARMLERGIPPHWSLYVATSDTDATAARAAENGAEVIQPPYDFHGQRRMAAIRDPTGAVVCIWQPAKHSGIGIAGENNAFCWADLNTNDPAKAAAFYSALFGWSIRPGENDPSGYLHIWNGELAIGGIPPVRPGNHPHWMIYFQVADCDDAASKAAGLGAKTYMPPMTIEKVGRMSVLADPQGAVFALFAPQL